MHRWDSLLPIGRVQTPLLPSGTSRREEGLIKMKESIFNTIKISIVFCCLMIIVRETVFFLYEILHRVNVK